MRLVLALLSAFGCTLTAQVSPQDRAALRTATGAILQAPRTAFSPETTLSIPKESRQYSVAVSGDTALVGAPDAMAAYVFMRQGTSWSLQAELKPRNTYGNPTFGASVALDGDTAVIGVPVDWGALYDWNVGSAYVFVRTGTQWALQADIFGQAFREGSRFGASVAVSRDTLLIGAPGGEFAEVYLRSGTTWTKQATLTPLNNGINDAFGSSVAISGDTAVVGAPYEDTNGTGINPRDNNDALESGAAYIFTRSDGVWSQQVFLKGSNTRGYDYFGYSVAIDRNTLAVGAPGDAHGVGQAYVFTREASNWSQQARFQSLEGFGQAVAVSGDNLVVTYPWWAGNEFGLALIYSRGNGDWPWTQTLRAPGGPPQSRDFGNSAAISGATILVGSFRVTPAAYVFTDANVCAAQFGAASQSFGAAGGGGTVVVQADAACQWAATSDQPWLTVTAGSPGTGNQSISFSVSANSTTSARTGTIRVSGSTFTVTQAGLPCSVSLSPSSSPIIPSLGGSGSFSIETAAGCFWNVIPQVDWLAMTPVVLSGQGPATLTFSVAPNSGPQRSGYISVGAQAFVVTQLGRPPSPGPFSRVGDMIHARSAYVASLLFDGRVLIAGGGFEQAELYDPPTATFRATGSLPAGHLALSATLLANGKVLIIGDDTPDLYDPATGLFAPTGNPLEGQGSLHKATLLPNGKVLITGGFNRTLLNGVCCAVVRAELYDPATGKFSFAGPYLEYEKWRGTGLNPAEPFAGTAAVLLADGKVLVATEPYAQVYDPATDSFSYTGSMAADSPRGSGAFDQGPSAVVGRTATLMDDGRVFLSGGIAVSWGTEDHLPMELTEVYDPKTGQFTRQPTMQLAREQHTGVLLPDGKVFVSGGTSDAFRVVTTTQTEAYDPKRGAFSLAGDMTLPRAASAVLLNDGSVLLAGGERRVTQYPRYETTKTAEVFQPDTAAPPPSILTVPANGQTLAAMQHANYELVTTAHPAVPGEHLILYVTGLQDESLIPPQVFFGGQIAEVTYFGNLPSYPGLGQINIRVPEGMSPSNAAPLRIRYRGRLSNEVSVPVRP